MSRKSRRNRYRQAQQKTAPRTIGDKMLRDAFTNSLAFLGGASELEKANDYTRRGLSQDAELMTVLYRENWLAKRIIDTPCDDMVRTWYDLETAVSKEKLDKFFKTQAHHNIKSELADAVRWARLYGGSLAIMVVKGQEDMLDQPLDFDMMQPGCFKGLLVIDKAFDIQPSMELEDDMDDPDFGEPLYYEVTVDHQNGETVKIHHSRTLVFKGRRLPRQEEINESYWGAPELEHIYEELSRMDATSAKIAQLVFQANLRVLKISDFGEAMAMASDQQRQRLYSLVQEQNRMMNSQGVQLLGAEDNMEQHAYTFTGIAEMYEKFCMNMAGAAEIPATKLFGRSPEGMNATGDSDMKNYYDMINQLQERVLKPALEKLLPVMMMSEWGKIPNDYEVVFNPIYTPTPSERADINSKNTGTIIQAYNGGLISQKTALEELMETGSEIGAWTKISAEDVEKASDEIETGEEGGGAPEDMGMDPMGNPMGGQMGGDPAGGMGDIGAMLQGMPQEGPQNAQEEAPAQPMMELPPEQAEVPQEEPRMQEEANDGGPGSGNFNHPGYRRGGGLAPQKAPIGQRLKTIFGMMRHEAKPVQKGGQVRSAANVQQANREREQWNNLSLGQKMRGAAEQNRHMAKTKASAYGAALRGDIPKAKQIMNRNEHYWSPSSEAAMKIQSEMLKRQMKSR